MRIRTVAAVAGAAAAAAAIIIGPIANAEPNDNANEHAEGGRSVAGVAGDGPAAVIGAIQSNRPDVPGLKTALSHVPTPSTTTVVAPP